MVTLLLSGLYYLYAVKNDSNFVIGLSIILVFIIVIPGILTNAILKAKVKKIMVDLPGFIDLVAVNVQTGISIDAALKQVAIDFKKLNPDLTYVMLRIIRKSELTGLSQALQDLSISLPTTEIRMFLYCFTTEFKFWFFNLFSLNSVVCRYQGDTIINH
ncbi:proteinTadC [Pasteurella multocida]|nr:proteinTadC [Pasteurella multocida]